MSLPSCPSLSNFLGVHPSPTWFIYQVLCQFFDGSQLRNDLRTDHQLGFARRPSTGTITYSQPRAFGKIIGSKVPAGKKDNYECWTKNRGKTPKWMVYFMENPIEMDDLGVPLFLETPLCWFPGGFYFWIEMGCGIVGPLDHSLSAYILVILQLYFEQTEEVKKACGATANVFSKKGMRQVYVLSLCLFCVLLQCLNQYMCQKSPIPSSFSERSFWWALYLSALSK